MATSYTGWDNVKDNLGDYTLILDYPLSEEYDKENFNFSFSGNSTQNTEQKLLHAGSAMNTFVQTTTATGNFTIHNVSTMPDTVEPVRSAVYLSQCQITIGDDGGSRLLLQFGVTTYGTDNRQYNVTIPQFDFDYGYSTTFASEKYNPLTLAWDVVFNTSEGSRSQKLSNFYRDPKYYTITLALFCVANTRVSFPLFKDLSSATNYVKNGIRDGLVIPTPPDIRKEYFINTICYKSTDGTKNNRIQVYTHTQTFKVNQECQMIRYTNKNVSTRYNHFWNYRNLDNNTFTGREDYIEYNPDGSISTQGSRENITAIVGMLNPYNTDTEINSGGFFAVISSNIPLRNNANDWTPDGGDPTPDPQNPTGDDDPSTDLPTPDVQLPLARTYAMTYDEMQTFASVLYTNDTTVLGDILDGLKMYGENPINFVADIYYIPFGVAPFCTTVNALQVPFGSYHADVPCKEITHNNSRYTMFDTIISGTYNDYRDYDSNYYLYLPYVGIFLLDHTKYLNTQVHCECTYDVHTGNMKYYLFSNGKLLDMYETSVRVSMPICGTDKSSDAFRTVNALEGIVNSTVSAIGGGIVNFGNVSGILKSFADFGEESIKAPDKHISGNSSPSNAVFDCTYPYLIIENYDYKKPSLLSAKYGTPDNDVNKIGSRSGYVECVNVRLETSATENEINEIVSLLNNGIIV